MAHRGTFLMERKAFDQWLDMPTCSDMSPDVFHTHSILVGGRFRHGAGFEQSWGARAPESPA